jgi:endonuclease/exonuclease/phosphatase family metal-dependent hydrolase
MQRKKGFGNLIHLSILAALAVIVIAAAGCSSSTREDALRDGLEVKVMSFNIAGDVDDDEDFKEWQRRKVLIGDIIRQQRPDVVGLQEAFLLNINDIIEEVGGYAYYGVNELGLDNDDAESLRLLYRTDRWQVDESNSGIFWFTSTPEVAGSKDWGALWIRDCVFARLVEKETNKGFYVYNSHWSYASGESRSKSARLLVERVRKQKYEEPFVAIGDFNARARDESIVYLKDSDDNPVCMKEAVYNYVDWIFSESGKFETVEAEIIDNEEASDHSAISAVIRFDK